jgi:hypothetical protein
MCRTNSNRCGDLIPERQPARSARLKKRDKRTSSGSHRGSGRWDTIRYAISSTPTTLRFCLIVVMMTIPPGLLAVLVHR